MSSDDDFNEGDVEDDFDDDVEDENEETRGDKRGYSGSDSDGENYQPEKKRHKGEKKKRKKDRGSGRINLEHFKERDVDVSGDESFSSDEQYDDEALEAEVSGFIVPDGEESEEEVHSGRFHRPTFDMPIERIGQKTAEQIAQEIEMRDEVRSRFGEGIEVDDDGGRRGISQKSRLPTVKDPRLWLVKTGSGMEKVVAARLLQKFISRQNSPQPLQIFSIVTQDHLKGYIYVEARRESHVRDAIAQMDGCFQFKVTMVAVEEMVQIMNVPKTKIEIKRGDWVKIKKGVYADDFAVVEHWDSENNTAVVKLIPRIDIELKSTEIDNQADEVTSGESAPKGRGKKKNAIRHPARLFNVDEATAIHGPESVEIHDTVKWNGMEFKDGFLYKSFSIKNLQFDNIKPSLEDIKNFTRVQRTSADDNNNEEELKAREREDLSFAKKAQQLLKKGPKVQYQKGDLVRVFEGELKSLIGEVQTVEGDCVKIIPRHKELLGQILPISASQLQKHFREGDHIKVRSGKHIGETGMIVKMAEDLSTVIVMSDVGNKELKLLISDIQKCTDISTGQKLGEYALYDFVQLGPQAFGVIVRIDFDCAHILEENGKVRQIKLQGIRGKKDSKKSLGRDVNNITIGKGDSIEIVEGMHKGKKGLVKHIYKFFVFVHNREITENNGIFVVKGKQCKLRGESHNSLNPALKPATSTSNLGVKPVYSGNTRTTSKRNDSILNKTVTITRGNYKGHAGIVRSANDTSVSVQLIASLAKVQIPRTNILEEKEPVRSESHYLDGYNTTPYGNQTPRGGATPMRPSTPMHYGGSTPNRPSTPAHDHYSSEIDSKTALRNSLGLEDQYSSNFELYNLPATPSLLSSSGTPYGDVLPKTPFTDVPNTYNNNYDSNIPTTPSVNYLDPQSPMINHYNTPQISDHGHDDDSPWWVPGIEVIVVDTGSEFQGKMGLIISVNGAYCKLQLYNEHRPSNQSASLGHVVDVEGNNLIPVKPSGKPDRAMVIRGENIGKRGSIANLIDQSEAIIKFDDTIIVFVKLDCLARLPDIGQ